MFEKVIEKRMHPKLHLRKTFKGSICTSCVPLLPPSQTERSTRHVTCFNLDERLLHSKKMQIKEKWNFHAQSLRYYCTKSFHTVLGKF